VTHSAADTVRRNLSRIRDEIAQACERSNRNPDDVTLVAVTKSVGVEEVQILFDLGVRHFGESRLHEAETKTEAIGGDAIWHMVGHIQRRKAKGVVERFNRIDAIDRIELAKALDQRAGESQKRIPALVEVNVSGETEKHGFHPDEVASAIPTLNEMEHLDIQGLMTMAPRADDPESARCHFANLRRIGEDLGLRELSMGMSEDYVVAVEEGSTQVRIGRALFKA
jgi:hypothetical protein